MIYLQLVSESDVGNHLTTGTVLLVGKARMVHVQVRLVLGHQVVAVVQVPSVTREPWVCTDDNTFRRLDTWSIGNRREGFWD